MNVRTGRDASHARCGTPTSRQSDHVRQEGTRFIVIWAVAVRPRLSLPVNVITCFVAGAQLPEGWTVRYGLMLGPLPRYPLTESDHENCMPGDPEATNVTWKELLFEYVGMDDPLAGETMVTLAAGGAGST